MKGKRVKPQALVVIWVIRKLQDMYFSAESGSGWTSHRRKKMSHLPGLSWETYVAQTCLYLPPLVHQSMAEGAPWGRCAVSILLCGLSEEWDQNKWSAGGAGVQDQGPGPPLRTILHFNLGFEVPGWGICPVLASVTHIQGEEAGIGPC